MSTHPYLPLYVDDYEAATAHLSPAEDGVYSRLLRLCWRTPGCSLPNDHAWIARKVRLSTKDYEALGRPLIEEFFKLSRGRFTQKRLKAEYDDISRKKSARVKAGKKGGDAKALKKLENDPSNATDLLAHTRAFPEPYPEPEEKKEANASSVAEPKPKARVYPEDFEAAWRAYPHHKGRSSKPNAAAVFAKLPPDERARMVDAIGRFVPNVAETCGGKGAPDMAVWLKDGKHLNWTEAEPDAQPAARFTGPAELRSSVVAERDEDFALRFLDSCGWRAEDRTLLARNAFTAAALARDLASWLARCKVQIEVQTANDTPRPAQTGAAA